MRNTVPPTLRGIVTGQAGTVSRRQALRAGLPRTTIDSKVKHGLWQQVHPGVYATFTGTIAWEALLWGAVLYAGPGALLSHETAAEVLCLTDRRSPVIQVTIPSSRRVRAPQGVRIHRSSVAYPRWRPLRGIPPHTFYADTIIDLVAAATAGTTSSPGSPGGSPGTWSPRRNWRRRWPRAAGSAGATSSMRSSGPSLAGP